MNNRERTLAVLRYENYDRLPIVHFGFWNETLLKWVDEGHLTPDEIHGYRPGNHVDDLISQKIGFDFNCACRYSLCCSLSVNKKDRSKRRTIIELIYPGGWLYVYVDGFHLSPVYRRYIYLSGVDCYYYHRRSI